MDAVQRMRQRAENNGGLTSTPNKWLKRGRRNKSVIDRTVQSGNDLCSVFNPAVVCGPAVYPIRRSITRRRVTTRFPSALASPRARSGRGGGWGWRPGWGHNDVDQSQQ
jgi:hypothetical protein